MLARPFRLFSAVTAVVLLAVGCAAAIEGTGTPASQALPSRAASPTPAENGIASLSADAVLVRAKDALASAKSVRVKADLKKGNTRYLFDIRYAGTRTTGTFTVAAGQNMEVRRFGETVYLKPNNRFWTENVGEAKAAVLAGKWLKTAMTDKRFGDMSEFLDVSKGGYLDPEGELFKWGRKTVRGMPTVALKDNRTRDTFYIASTGPAYPLRIVSEPGGAEGSIDFLDYGKPVSVRVPPEELIVDTSKVPGS